MKKYTILLLIMLIASICEAKIYVCLDKTTGEPKGVIDIQEKSVVGWAKQYILLEADENYRGKQGFEIKFDGEKLRKATKQEIDAYNSSKSATVLEDAKKKSLELLGLTADDVLKIKALGK